MLKIFVLSVLLFSHSLVSACTPGDYAEANWSFDRLIEGSIWVVEGTVLKEILKDNDVQFLIKPKKVFKGPEQDLYTTDFYMRGNEKESLPGLNRSCKFSVNLKLGKDYIFTSLAKHSSSVMEASDKNRKLIKKALKAK